MSSCEYWKESCMFSYNKHISLNCFANMPKNLKAWPFGSTTGMERFNSYIWILYATRALWR